MIKKIIFFVLVVIVGSILFSPKIDISNSKNYYEDNSKEITELIKIYKQIQKKQNFGFGYLDNDYKEYLAQIYGDSTRYIYKSEITKDQIFDEIKESNLTREDLELISKQIKKAKAIWIDSEDIYLSGYHQKGTVISLKAQAINAPFTPTRFYTLLIMDDLQSIRLKEDELANFNIHEIEPGIYQTISNQFR